MTVETIVLNAGSGGSSVAVDTVAGASYQLVKVVAGGDGDAGFGADTDYYRSAGAANQDAHQIKASAVIIYSISITNTNAAARYFKLYNAAAPTSASTPVFVMAIPGAGGWSHDFSRGIRLGTAGGIRLTTGSADNDAAAVAAGEVMVNITYL